MNAVELNDLANAGAMRQLERLGRLDMALRDFVPAATLPRGLMDYGPAHRWTQQTVDWWCLLTEYAALDSGVIKGQTIPLFDWIAIRNDMLRSTGPTPWMQDLGSHDPRLLFAGWTLRPDKHELARLQVTP